MSSAPRAGLYLHIPFCSAICPYCDFAVTTGGEERRRAYTDRLIEEIALCRGDAEAFGEFDTIYFGGGTPTAIGPRGLGRLLEALHDDFRVSKSATLSVEANPEDIDQASAASLRDLGVHTISLGVQSFDDDELRFLGRRHDASEARRSVEASLDTGFDVVSIDVIFGLPSQKREVLRSSLREAAQLGAHHVSCYQLTVHAGTPFARRQAAGRLEELSEDEQADSYALVHEVLGDADFEAYEVSNFARRLDCRSLHNSKYWTQAPYLGLGVSAHSFCGSCRWWNERETRRYEERVSAGERPVADREELSEQELALETVMLRLRTREGLDLEAFRARFGIDLAELNQQRIERSVGAGLARLESGSLSLTPRGFAVVDAIVRDLEILS